MRTELGALLVVAALAVVPAAVDLRAQGAPPSISGTVRDSSGQPVVAAIVEIEATNQRFNTSGNGAFRLEGIRRGTHLLRVSKTGFLPRHVRFVIDDHLDGNLNLGSIFLTPLSGDNRGLLTVTGTITDRETGTPVPSVAVGLNGTVVAVTNGSGLFRGVAQNVARNETNRLTTQRLGYAPVDRVFQLPETVTELDFVIELDPTSVELPAITVEATASARLTDAGFFRREKSTFGDFFDAEDIGKMQAQAVTDILRRVPGATVWSAADAIGNPGSGNDGQVYVRFSRRLGSVMAGMSVQCHGNPLLFVDNGLVPIGMLDFVRDPERLAGVEVYQTQDQTPVEYAAYNPDGNCGTIVLWTKDAAGTNAGSSPFSVGAHIGATLADGTSPDRVGGQLTIPFRGPLLVYLGFTRRMGGRGSASQVFLSMQVKPFGTRNPFYGAMGVALDKPQLVMKAHHLVLAGFAVPVDLGPLQPFTEFHVTGPLTGHGQVFGFAGLNLRIDAR